MTSQIRDGLFIARALEFVDGENVATKATATATDKAGNTAADTNTGIDLDTSIDVWYTYDASGRREYKYEDGSYQSDDPYTKSGDTISISEGGRSCRLRALQAMHLFACSIVRSALESAHAEAGTHSGSGVSASCDTARRPSAADLLRRGRL